MTRAEYEAKYGIKPVLPAVSSIDTSPTPRRMTRAEYDAEYNKPKETVGTFEKIGNRINEFNPFYQIPKMAIEGGLKFGEGVGKMLTAPTPEERLRATVSAGAGATQGLLAVPFGLFNTVTGLPGVKQITNFLWSTDPNELSIANLIGDKVADIKPVQDFVAKYQHSPEIASDLITIIMGLGGKTGLKQPKLTKEIQTGFQQAYKKAQGGMVEPVTQKLQGKFVKQQEQKNIKINESIADEIIKIENSYSKLPPKGTDRASALRIAQSDIMPELASVNGRLEKSKAFELARKYENLKMDGAEKTVTENLAREGAKVNINEVYRDMTIKMHELFSGEELTTVLNGVKKEINGLLQQQRGGKPVVDEFGNVLLEDLQRNKINTTKYIDYNKNETSTVKYKKAKAQTYKEIIENKSKVKVDYGGKSYTIQEINKELGKYFNDAERIRNLGGKTVKGAKLGKYFAQITGNLVGAGVGGAVGGTLGVPGLGVAVGTVVGGETASFIKGEQMKGVFGKTRGIEVKSDPLLQAAKEQGKLPPKIDLSIPDTSVGSPKDVVKTKKIYSLEKQISKNVEAQKEAIKGRDFTLVATLKEIYLNLVDKLKEEIKKETTSNPPSPSSKSSKISKISQKESPQPSVNDTTNLTQEARKYKSAEDFERAQPTYYHTTSTESAKSIEQKGFKPQMGDRSMGVANAKGTWLYDNTTPTNEFGKNFKNPTTIEVKLNGRVFDAMNNDKSIRALVEDKALMAKLKTEGYVGIKGDEMGTSATFIFDNNAIKTKSQLTDIWNKANKK